MVSKVSLIFVLLSTLAWTHVACDREKSSAQAPVEKAAAVDDTALPTLSLPPDSGPPPAIDSERAMRYVKEIVAFGPRPLGSANHKKVEDYIAAHLKGDSVEEDAFTADTPGGKFPVRNFVAKFPGMKDGIVVIASHYDTNYPLRDTSFVGANDGASSSGLLLEIANQLRGKTLEGYSVWLVWDDAEEAIKPDTELDFSKDSLY
ncbi:MAG: M28 family peptidase, partial [Candidatus Sulfotelmatobacter sp.]